MAEYACKCLNVRMRAQPAQGSPPEVDVNEFQPIYAGDSGVNIVHNQLALRSRTHAKPEPQSKEPMLRRYMSLTCLICDMLVYRVVQLFPPDVESTDGPVLPTEDWVEQETLKSSTGWFEISKACLVSSVTSPSLPTARTSLPPLPPLLSPAPFTPSHVVFRHLASLASERSNQIRQSAEEHLTSVINAKVIEIEAEEGMLRSQVQALWVRFRSKVSQLEEERKEKFRLRSTQTNNASWSRGSATSDSTQATPISVQDFVVSGPPLRALSSSSGGRAPSALSASLAGFSFHHPRAEQSDGSSSLSSSSSRTLAERSLRRVPSPSRSPRLMQSRRSNSLDHNGGESRSYGPFRRNLNEDKDIATSFKYVTDIESEMARVVATRHERNGMASGPTPPEKAPPSHVDQHRPIASQTVLSPKAENTTDAAQGSSKSRGKRKVTFDIKPDVPNIEDARRHTPRRSISGSGLPQSLSLLRPSSLPPPSNLRALPQPGAPASPNRGSPEPHSAFTSSGLPSIEQPLSPREAELSRLVAAGTPSHRSAWKRDSKAWQLFVNKVTPNADDDDDNRSLNGVPASQSNGVLYDQEDEDWSQSIAKSLPVFIGLNGRVNGTSSRTVEASNGSSAAIRRASYAERDRGRSMDPGALDFEAADDDDESDADNMDNMTQVGNRGRRQALKILQARSELPAEGMWRSLAT
ncbi:hypothetical protein HETIRDRAFT_123713 [Heterobasidion irregulare TC 32-1]|uniref:Uncharacterized protein n=1 Tax=Heterobasidion irregulare (strain TC 32-1) TaxID=747525 RepID=W4KFC7_HETIT|nr:uncharacterized protein HETIRDRAFT_123713 [Heterobasidion irregulare TC 32-1]ETW84015.1 hypothetical protein HETIRDRAFT_123713 [Heterobasidion irregulare TC 32-1]